MMKETVSMRRVPHTDCTYIGRMNGANVYFDGSIIAAGCARRE